MRGRWLTLKTPSLILLVLLATLSGCIVTYRDFPNATLESLPKDREAKPLYYHVEPIITKLSSEQAKGSSWLITSSIMTVLLGWYALVPQIDPIGQPGYDEVARTLRASGMLSDLIKAPESESLCSNCKTCPLFTTYWATTFAGEPATLFPA